MTFSELLNEYICIFRCTAGELANASGLTQASLSRYRNGQRMPETDTLKKLASGIARIAAQNGTDLDLDLVFSQLAEAAGIVKTDHTQFSGQFSFLIDAISINLSELAKSMGYDPSYLSRIKKGQRMPGRYHEICGEPERFFAAEIRRIRENEIDLQAAGLLHRKGYILPSGFHCCNNPVSLQQRTKRESSGGHPGLSEKAGRI